MIYSFIVFLLLLIAIWVPAWMIANNDKDEINLYADKFFYAILLSYSLIVGLRWNVGSDYMTYYYIYNGYAAYGEIERLEIIPRYLMFFGNFLKLPFSFWFIAMALIQILFVTLGTTRKYKPALPYVLLFFLYFFLGHNMNIVRQGAAYSIVYYAFCILDKEKKKSVFFTLCWLVTAFFVHRSAIITIPFVLLIYVNRVPKVSIQILIYVLASLFGTIYLKDFILSNSTYLSFLGGDIIADRILNLEEENSIGSGMGVLFQDAICLFIFISSSNFLSKAPSLKLMYLLFLVGSSFYRASMVDQYTLRIDMFLSFFIILFGGIAIYNYRNSNKRIIGEIILFLTVVFYLYVSQTYDWSFVWN